MDKLQIIKQEPHVDVRLSETELWLILYCIGRTVLPKEYSVDATSSVEDACSLYRGLNNLLKEMSQWNIGFIDK